MARVVVTGKIPQIAVDQLRASHDVQAWSDDAVAPRAELLSLVKIGRAHV